MCIDASTATAIEAVQDIYLYLLKEGYLDSESINLAEGESVSAIGKVLVTGGAGYIGSHTVLFCWKQGSM